MTLVGCRPMPATHPSEILTDGKHDQPHGRLDGVRRRARRPHEFAQVLTLLKLHARMVALTTFLGSPVPLGRTSLGTLLAKLKVRPLLHSEREVVMAAVSGRMSPRLPLDRCPAREPATPTSYGPARRGAALLGAMMGCGERLGCVGMGVGACGWVGRVDWCGPGLSCARA